jgi:hypothetical protein
MMKSGMSTLLKSCHGLDVSPFIANTSTETACREVHSRAAWEAFKDFTVTLLIYSRYLRD